MTQEQIELVVRTFSGDIDTSLRSCLHIPEQVENVALLGALCAVLREQLQAMEELEAEVATGAVGGVMTLDESVRRNRQRSAKAREGGNNEQEPPHAP